MIHPDARKEVLKRRLLLNHEVHEAEERGISYEELEKEKIIALLQDQVETWAPGCQAIRQIHLEISLFRRRSTTQSGAKSDEKL